MTKEQLLSPRYKVIADYPGSPCSVGWIMKYSQQRHPLSIKGWRKLYDPYPHLFKPLQWWEEREEKDMPNYLLMNHPSKKVVKAFEHFVFATHGWGFIDENEKAKSYINYLPATEQEYNEYISKK